MWYVWVCNQCSATLTINYDATAEDYKRFKDCVCKDKGIYEWKHSYEEIEKEI